MLHLLKTDDGWRGVFCCDKCDRAIEDIDDGVVLIQDRAGKYEPRSHFHKRCLSKDSQSQQMPLRQFIQAVITGMPDVHLPDEQ